MKWQIFIILFLLACDDKPQNPAQNSQSPPVQPALIPQIGPNPTSAPIAEPVQEAKPPASNTFEQYTGLKGDPISLGCSRASIVQAAVGALYSQGKSAEIFSRELEKEYNIPIRGEGFTSDRLQVLANVLAKTPQDVRPSEVIFFPTHKDYMSVGKADAEVASVLARTTEKGSTWTLRISPNAFARGEKRATFVIAHELGHISHGPIDGGINAEDLADAFAARIIGMTREQSYKEGTPFHT